MILLASSPGFSGLILAGHMRYFAKGQTFGLSLLFVGLLACQTEAERLRAESIYFLQQAKTILERNVGNQERALEELDKFLRDNRERILETKARGQAIMRKMAPGEREEFKRRSAEAVKPLKEQIMTLVRAYPNPPAILQRLRELL